MLRVLGLESSRVKRDVSARLRGWGLQCSLRRLRFYRGEEEPTLESFEVTVEEMPLAAVEELGRFVSLEIDNAGVLEVSSPEEHCEKICGKSADAPAKDIEGLERVIDEIRGESLEGRVVVVQSALRQ